jgi:hypothetical protein
LDTFEFQQNQEIPLVCLVFENTWDGEANCESDETRTVGLPRNGPATVDWVCHSDVFWPILLGKLSYGSNWTMHGYDCSINTDGVRCTNQSGNGFHVRASMYDLF